MLYYPSGHFMLYFRTFGQVMLCGSPSASLSPPRSRQGTVNATALPTSPLNRIPARHKGAASGSPPLPERPCLRTPEIQRALDRPSAPESRVRVHHGRLDILVTEQFLDRSDVKPRLQHVRGKRVAQPVRRNHLGDPGSPAASHWHGEDTGSARLVTPLGAAASPGRRTATSTPWPPTGTCGQVLPEQTLRRGLVSSPSRADSARG